MTADFALCGNETCPHSLTCRRSKLVTKPDGTRQWWSNFERDGDWCEGLVEPDINFPTDRGI